MSPPVIVIRATLNNLRPLCLGIQLLPPAVSEHQEVFFLFLATLCIPWVLCNCRPLDSQQSPQLIVKTNCGPKSFCSLLYFLPTVLTPKKGIYQQTSGSMRNTDIDTMCCIMGLIYSKFSSYFFPACTIQFKWACPKNTPNRPLCCKNIDVSMYTVLALPPFHSSFKFQFVPSLTTQGRHRAPFHMQICGIEREPAARCRIEAGISRVAIMWRTTTTLPSAMLDIASSQLITQMYIMGGQ